MDTRLQHPEADLADLLRLIRHARDLGRHEELCEPLEKFVNDTWFVLKFARAVIQEGLGRNEGIRDSINSLIVVASFISGVQAQLIAFTYQSNHTGLQITTNFFLFVGMTLDVIGAATGVVSIILVRQYVERSRSLLTHITEIHRRIYEITKSIDHDAKPINHREEMAKLQKMCGDVQDVLEAHTWLSTFDGESDSDIPNTFRAILEKVPVRPAGGRGPPLPYFVLVPVIAITLGTLCFLASVLAFAASSQLRDVWLTGVIITMIAFLLMLLLWGIRKAAKKKGANYKSLEESLRDELRHPLLLKYHQ
ncbi:hypothetical protein JB92DRAFT_3125167 [Gautieria morchelliformis]|nr:hypothetical protein JB92DRAFT_3125167 [Gautieria morchelliformis]